MKRRFLNLLVILCSAVVLAGPASSSRAAVSTQQTTQFLMPPYYGTTSVTSVFDHDLPLWQGDDGNDWTTHYDGTQDGPGARSSYDQHRGIDYALRYELVRAAAPGTVARADWANVNHRLSYGLHVRIDHDIDHDGNNDYRTIYGHMSVLHVQTGDPIPESGEFQRIIGISGNTGWCQGVEGTGPNGRCTDNDPPTCGAHLHFQLEENGIAVNPYGWIGGAGNDPWENDARGAASHDVWLRYPSITNDDVFPADAPLHAPPIVENESGYFTVDDGSTNFVETPAGCWTVDNTDGWAGDYRHRDVPDGSCTATWNFPQNQPAGRYHVFIHIPNDNVAVGNRNATVDAAQYTIRHTESPARPWDKEYEIAVIDQWVYPNDYHTSRWVYAGICYFDTNQYGTDYVRLESDTMDSRAGVMAADAVRFSPVVYRTYLPLVMKRWPPIPDVPVLNPIHNPDNSPNYTVSWEPAYLADTYILQEATNPGFAGAVTRYSGTGTSWLAVGQPVGTYYYRVKASNSWGDSDWSNVEQTTVLPPAGWQTITSQDFEGTFPGEWIVWDDNGAAGGEYHWNKRACRPYAGSYSGWGVGGGADGAALSCGSDYPHDADGWMYYGPFDLEDAVAGELRFKLWLYTEPDNDYVFRGASIDGIHFYGYATSGNTQGWNDKVLDLANVPTLGNLLGESQVWVALVFSSNSSVNYAEGGYVDDVVVRKCFRGPCPSGSQGLIAPGDGQVREIPATMIRNR